MSCCCCCCGGTSEGSEPEPGPGPGQELDPELRPPQCTRYKVTIESINVTDINDGLLGGSLETDWTFVVNGQVEQWENEDMDEGVYNIGISFFVDVPTDTSTIVIEVSGIERDPLAPDDPLPVFSRTWGKADDWGLGAQSGTASNSTITYTLNYSINCVISDTIVAVSREALTEYGRRKADQRGVDVADRTAMSWALTRLQRDGWNVEHASEDEFVVSGSGNLPKLIQQEFDR
jgi:hypothetical protein